MFLNRFLAVKKMFEYFRDLIHPSFSLDDSNHNIDTPKSGIWKEECLNFLSFFMEMEDDNQNPLKTLTPKEVLIGFP